MQLNLMTSVLLTDDVVNIVALSVSSGLRSLDSRQPVRHDSHMTACKHTSLENSCHSFLFLFSVEWSFLPQ